MEFKSFRLHILSVLAFALVLLPGFVRAQSSEALVDMLVQKGVLTEQEGEDVKADLAKEYKSTGGGKLDVAKQVKKLKLYGDFRARYEFQETKRTAAALRDDSHNAENWRARIRLRVGAEYTLDEGLKTGVQLATGGQGADTDQRSTNQTLGNAFTSPDLYLDLAYGQIDLTKYFKSTDLIDELTICAGIFKNPIKSSNMMWDGDINPNGAYEKFSWDYEIEEAKGKVYLVTGQFLWDDNIGGGYTGVSGGNQQDAWLLPFQVGTEVKLPDEDSFNVAVSYYWWLPNEGPGGDIALGAGGSNRGTAGNGQNQFTNLCDIGPIVVYADYKFKDVFDSKLPLKLWAEYAYNLSNPGRFKDNSGVQAGAQVGEAKKKGQWEVGAYFNYLEENFWYDGFIDSDFSNGAVNRVGYVVKAGYAFTDFATFNFAWYDADPIYETQNMGFIATEVSRCQLDINIKF